MSSHFQQSGFMQKLNGSKLFSKSAPTLQIVAEKKTFGRTLSLVTGQPKDLYIPINQYRTQDPTIFKPFELMTSQANAQAYSKSTFLMYDPLRVVSDLSRPPKRFYRTFWQSAARRIMMRSR
jgi:hypothetical protein